MKKLFISILFFSVATSLQQTHAMQPVAGRLAWQVVKPYATKGVAGLATAAQCYLAAGSLYKEGFNKTNRLANTEKALANHLNTDQPVTQFIAEEMRNLSSKNDIKSVTVDFNLPLDKSLEAVGKNHILISLPALSEINKALREDDSKTLNKWRSVMQQANQRLQNNDSIVQTVACFTLPFITHLSLKALRHNLPFAAKTPSFLKAQLSKIKSGGFNGAVSILAYNALQRYQVQRADDGMKNDLDSLNGLKDFLQPFADAETDGLEKAIAQKQPPFDKNQKTEIRKNYKEIRKLTNFIENSPVPAERLKKINERIMMLELEDLVRQQPLHKETSH